MNTTQQNENKFQKVESNLEIVERIIFRLISIFSVVLIFLIVSVDKIKAIVKTVFEIGK